MTVDDAVRSWWSSLTTPGVPRGVVVAVSGGADSTALAVAIANLLSGSGSNAGARLLLAHYNHRTRSDREHAEDLNAVTRLATRLRLPIAIDRADATPGLRGGPEASARRLRYRFLSACADAVGASIVCTGHTADDQAETMLMRLLRGPGPAELGGIPRSREMGTTRIERPLLAVGRSEIVRYLRSDGYEWREDPSNRDVSLRRNLVRHEILPRVAALWPAVRRDLGVVAAALEEERVRVRKAARRVPATRIPSPDGAPAVAYDRERFFASEPAVRLEILYGALRELDALDSDDRPTRRFFAPLLGPDPGGDTVVRSARGVSVRLAGRRLVLSSHVVRGG